MEDVYNEVNEILVKNKISEFRNRPVTKKYAFELTDVPRECDYLEVLYPFSSNHYFLLSLMQNLNYLWIYKGRHSVGSSVQILRSSKDLSWNEKSWDHVGFKSSILTLRKLKTWVPEVCC